MVEKTPSDINSQNYMNICEYVEFFFRSCDCYSESYPQSVTLLSTQFLYSFWSEKLQIPILTMNWHRMSCTADMC